MFGVSSIHNLYGVSWNSIQNDMRMQQLVHSTDGKITQIPKLPPVHREFSSANAQFLRDYQKHLTGLMTKANHFRHADLPADKKSSADTESVRDLVNSYNDTLKFMNDHAGMGSGVMHTMGTLLRAPLSDRQMDAMGLSVKKDGTIDFDADAFNKNAEKNTTLLREDFGLADRIYDAARSGMNIASSRLLDGGKQPFPGQNAVQSQQDRPAFGVENPFALLSRFSRQNPYLFSGSDLVGLLINLNA